VMFVVQYSKDSSCKSLSQTQLNTADSFLVEITVQRFELLTLEILV